MTDERLFKILEASAKLLNMNEAAFFLWIDTMTKDERREFAKGVSEEFGVDENTFLKKLVTRLILKSRPWVREENISFENLL